MTLGMLKSIIAIVIFLYMVDFPLSLIVIGVFMWVTTKGGPV